MTIRKRRRRKSRYHTGIYQSIKGGTIKYRSGWELSVIQYLDTLESVIEFRYESLKIPYISNIKTGKTRNYIPDLLVTFSDKKQILYEIKPLRKVATLVNRKKFAAARIWCVENNISFEILTEVELKSLNIL